MAAREQHQPSIYQLKVTIKDIRPPIWRRLQVRGDITLAHLHDVLQTAFGWTDSHLHQFIIRGAYYGVPHPEDELWGTPMVDEGRARLKDVLGGGVKSFIYEYDFGDDWLHAIAVEKVLASEEGVVYPRCVTGRRACPPEDCGGPWGYAELLETVRDPEHPDHEELREWLGEEFDPEAFDIDAVNAGLRPKSRRRKGARDG